jgi:hypothetical protein
MKPARMFRIANTVAGVFVVLAAADAFSAAVMAGPLVSPVQVLTTNSGACSGDGKRIDY